MLDERMDEKRMKEIEERLNAIPWASATKMTPEAEALVEEHVVRIRRVIEHLVATKGRAPLDAYADAQSAGYMAQEYEPLLEMLFQRVNYGSAPAKEPLTLTIASHYFWDRDPDMGHLPDPWAPLLKLYEMGYTSTFDQDDEAETLSTVINLAGKRERSYPIS
jgi:hypothetical protein